MEAAFFSKSFFFLKERHTREERQQYENFKSHVIVVNCISVARREFRVVRGVDAEINAC
jgi:hypothetical protein